MKVVRGSKRASTKGAVARRGHPAETHKGDHFRLLRKYRLLSTKYAALVKKFEAQSNERLGTFKLAWWALSGSQTGIALVRKNVVAIVNPVFEHMHTTAEGDVSVWRPLQDESTVHLNGSAASPVGSLREVVLHEAAHLARSGKRESRVRRFERIDGERFLEMHFERALEEKTPIVVALAHDVTGRVRAEGDLAEARRVLAEQHRVRALGELAAGIAHDLNNTIHAMKFHVALVQADAACTPAQKTHIATLLRVMTDLGERAGRLQDFARRRTDESVAAVDLAEVVKHALELARPELERDSPRAIPIRVDVDVPPMPRVAGNSAELNHVFLNLFLNARDAMPEGGTIRVRAESNATRVVVTVEDEGTGISPAHIARVFEPFFTTKGARGMGLGLSMAHWVMSRIGGSISATNRKKKGAVMILSFPLASATYSAAPEALRDAT